MPEVADQDQTMAQEEQRAHAMSSAPQPNPTTATDDSDSRAREDAEIIKAGLAAVAEWEAEHGPFTEEEIAWANEVLDRGERHYQNLKNR
ncbi:hypothetical protein [Candidatus Poriferisocius sp.]|uniref:hypothetical protein n=1 Tax=Candidatus Poriferisocius sp. TaxID=3101276 RepID=UPI003B024422